MARSLDGDDGALAKRLDFVRLEPERGKDFGAVFAYRRRLPAQCEIVITDLDRQPR